MTTRNFSPVGIGYHPDYIGCYVMNRTGATLAVGELVMFDMKIADGGFGGNASAAVYADQAAGLETYALANVITPATAGIGVGATDPGFYFGVVDDTLGGSATAVAGADDTMIHVCVKGIVKVKMTSTVGAEDTAPGEYGKAIFATNAVRTATATAAVGLKAVGRLLEENTVASALSTVLFNGIEGVGVPVGT